jgi:hypothetical protein
MAHTPLKMTIEDARRETDSAWRASYSSKRNAQAIDAIRDAPFKNRVSHLVSRLFFRGIYFPQITKWAWVRVIFENRRAIFSLAREGFITMRTSKREKTGSAVNKKKADDQVNRPSIASAHRILD